MKKWYLTAILGVCILATGCTSQNVASTQVLEAATTKEEATTEDKDQATTTEATEAEVTDTTATTDDVQAKDIFDQYKDDLLRLRFSQTENSEIKTDGDYIEVTNAVITEKYYLDASYVESKKAGDTIDIKDLTYKIDTMEYDDYGYFVQLTLDDSEAPEDGVGVYEDIYRFAPTEDKQHYYIFFCSDDIITNDVYEGSIYIAKDAIINGYYGEEIKDGNAEDFLKQEYSYLSAMEFKVDENGVVTWIQNQVAG